MTDQPFDPFALWRDMLSKWETGVNDVTIRRPQEIPRYVADGLFDRGITGRDWMEETGVDVATLAQLHYSKATARPIRPKPTTPSVAPADRSRPRIMSGPQSHGSARRRNRSPSAIPGSYPHLTLPTIYAVYLSVLAVSFSRRDPSRHRLC